MELSYRLRWAITYANAYFVSADCHSSLESAVSAAIARSYGGSGTTEFTPLQVSGRDK